MQQSAGIDWKHVGILMGSHAKYAVRGGSGLTFVLIVIILGLTVAGFLVDPLDGIRKEYERKHDQAMPREAFFKNAIEGARPIIGWWLGTSASESEDPKPPGQTDVPDESSKEKSQLDYLLEDRPALLSVMFLILLSFAPFVMAFGGSNQLSGDIASRGLRYLLLRTSRANIVLARLIGTFVFSAATSLFTLALIVGFLAMRFDLYSGWDLVTWALYGWGALCVFGLPYLALCTWISTAVASPFGALAVAQLAIGVPIVLIKYAQLLGTGQLDLKWLDRLTPWGWKFDLLHPEPAKVVIAVAVMLGFFALFLFLGMRHFLKRDL
jgi:hypothetical protein